MSIAVPKLYKQPHDLVMVKVGIDYDYLDLPRGWSNEEMEDWIFKARERRGDRLLRREVHVISRKPVKDKWP